MSNNHISMQQNNLLINIATIFQINQAKLCMLHKLNKTIY